MIRRGEPWGHAAIMPDTVVEANSDAALAMCDRSELIFISHGDIARSIGNPTLPAKGSRCTEISVDAMKCTLQRRGSEDLPIIAASSIVVGRFWKGRHIVVSNAGWLNDANLAPRAHPNDGVVEMLTMSSEMNLRQRFFARRRMFTGTHLPHPDITMRRESSIQILREGNETLKIDGIDFSEWTHLAIDVMPDYWRVLV